MGNREAETGNRKTAPSRTLFQGKIYVLLVGFPLHLNSAEIYHRTERRQMLQIVVGKVIRQCGLGMKNMKDEMRDT